MLEGWHGDDYLILFDESEVAAASDRYEVLRLLPGFKVLGLRSWDDFIVRNASGQIYSVPTLPLDARPRPHALAVAGLRPSWIALIPRCAEN